jgi:hypothetical protein
MPEALDLAQPARHLVPTGENPGHHFFRTKQSLVLVCDLAAAVADARSDAQSPGTT